MAKKDKIPPNAAGERAARHPSAPDDTATLSRRTLLSWLGNATVVALTAEVLTACGAESPQSNMNTRRQPRLTTPGSANFEFSPPPEEGELYKTWWGNTVDEQDLQKILATWTLKISGLVEKPLTLSFAQLLALPRQNQITDFHCVEGWSVFDVPWNGVHIDNIIELVRPTSEASHLTLRCFSDVYTESLPLAVAREPRSLLAYGIDEMSLPLTHGFPLRMVVPRQYGYKNAKWVKEIEFTNAPIDGYWEQRSYPNDAPVRANKLREGKY